ncbi:hypothetical protein Fmac_014346 [Flemingia macrophylla]|uniref:XS domain-containing protein n=1 Tax=Flemingia macrophylla TaxID=520843 RepID=A0ABD1MBF9_9FABA
MAFQLKTEPGSPPDFTSTTHRNYQEIRISGLISELRSAYEVEHYDRVEVELVKRDTKLKSDIGSLHEKIREESDRSEKVISNRSEEFVKDGPGVLVNDSSEKVVSDRAVKVVRNNRSTKKIINDRSRVVVNNSSEKVGKDQLFVFPWMGIVADIATEFKDRRHIEEGGANLRDTFTLKGFHPLRVHPLWNRNGHSGYAIVEFSKNWEGFTNAINFEKNFEAECCSKKDYYNLRHQGIDCMDGYAANIMISVCP